MRLVDKCFFLILELAFCLPPSPMEVVILASGQASFKRSRKSGVYVHPSLGKKNYILVSYQRVDVIIQIWKWHYGSKILLVFYVSIHCRLFSNSFVYLMMRHLLLWLYDIYLIIQTCNVIDFWNSSSSTKDSFNFKAM